MTDNQIRNTNRMLDKLKLALQNQTIKDVSFMSQEDVDENYEHWSGRPIVITMESGIQLIPMQDTEGNDSGILDTNIEGAETVWEIDFDDKGKIPTTKLSKSMFGVTRK